MKNKISDVKSIQRDYILAMAQWKEAHAKQEKKFNDFLEIKQMTEEEAMEDDNFVVLSEEYEEFARKEIVNLAFAFEYRQNAEQAVVDFGIELFPKKHQEKIRYSLRILKNKENLISLIMETRIIDFSRLKRDLNIRLSA